jgi:hypothetical protein
MSSAIKSQRAQVEARAGKCEARSSSPIRAQARSAEHGYGGGRAATAAREGADHQREDGHAARPEGGRLIPAGTGLAAYKGEREGLGATPIPHDGGELQLTSIACVSLLEDPPLVLRGEPPSLGVRRHFRQHQPTTTVADCSTIRAD